MNNQSEILIRLFEPSDLDKLIRFFIKAYGANTIFQDKNFLKYYFYSRDNQKSSENNSKTACVVGLDLKSGEIISHYGGLFYKLNLNDKIIPIIWGVNAYTLPQWRGQGINSKIVEYIHNSNAINAVIGMPFEAPFFYKKLGYNIFDKDTFTRYVYLLSAKTFIIIESMKRNMEYNKNLLILNKSHDFKFDSTKIVKITKNNIDKFGLDFNISSTTTTNRDYDFIRWRLLENPYINYDIFAYISESKIRSYIVLREETLQPHNFKVCRMIDLFGESIFINDLLSYCKYYAIQNEHIYIDFSAYGNLYKNELISSEFSVLENEDYCLLPQVTAPIENRPNHEFIVIQSKTYANEISKLSNKNTYFTRIDADRDRIANISQIKGG